MQLTHNCDNSNRINVNILLSNQRRIGKAESAYLFGLFSEV
jgi:hypothetical protein